ncbi:MAG: hypothetical protein IJ897_04280 [Prevotella sp.]|nr:hypothetical protein [Prevotella sp.]
MQTVYLAVLMIFMYFCNAKTTDMERILIMIMTGMLLLSTCSDKKSEETYFLQGAWVLRHVEYPIGREYDYPQEGMTFCRVYDRDSTMYECRMSETATGLIIMPCMKADIMLADHGDRLLYLEGDNPRPLTVTNDSIIVIQRNGVLFTWKRAKDIEEQWSSDICEIVSADLKGNGDGDGSLHHYMLSAREQEQENVIQGFIWFSVVIIIMVFAIAHIAVSNRREKRRLMLQLKQIQEVQENRPQVIRQAMETVEGEFLASDDYQSLLRRIASGQRLKEEEWDGIESLTRRVWPGFSSQLRSLYPMSELEYQVSMLIRLRIPPTDIAAVLVREASTISTVRSRLYKKVFGKKGGAKEWDEFVLSIGI